MASTSEIYLSKSALQHNLNFIRNLIGENMRFSSVVKGNAYGHGIDRFVPLAQSFGVDHFSVYSADEALEVQQAGNIETDIMVMGMQDDVQLAWAIENGLSFYIYDFDNIQLAVTLAKKIGKPARVHIEVETGMNRTGLSKKEFIKVLDYIKDHGKNLIIEGLCTHFAGAESIANYHRIKKQQKIYAGAYEKMIQKGIQPKYRHTACSAALLRYPKTQMDLVRVGILQYGFFPSKEIQIHHYTKNRVHDYPLKRIISWKSRVMNVKSVKSGEFIGYGTSYLANNNMVIATVPVGYAHGFSRSLSNQGRVLIHGQRVPVIGTVNMNMMTVDVTNLENVKRGDEVVIIGRQGDMELSVASFSDFSMLVNYELLTRLPRNIERIVTD